jgi:hypothetical protein
MFDRVIICSKKSGIQTLDHKEQSSHKDLDKNSVVESCVSTHRIAQKNYVVSVLHRSVQDSSFRTKGED